MVGPSLLLKFPAVQSSLASQFEAILSGVRKILVYIYLPSVEGEKIEMPLVVHHHFSNKK